MFTFSVSNVIARLACCPIYTNVRTFKAAILMSFLGFTSGANCEVPSARDLDGNSAALLCAVQELDSLNRKLEKVPIRTGSSKEYIKMMTPYAPPELPKFEFDTSSSSKDDHGGGILSRISFTRDEQIAIFRKFPEVVGIDATHKTNSYKYTNLL